MGLDVYVLEPLQDDGSIFHEILDEDVDSSKRVFDLFPQLVAEREEQYIDFAARIKELGIIIDEDNMTIEEYDLEAKELALTIFEKFDPKNESHIKNGPDILAVIKESDCKPFTVKEKILCCKEIGYMRKPFNNAFYKDYENSSCNIYITTKDELDIIYSKYIEKGCKREFKKQIVDKFIEGKNFININW